MTAYLAVMEQFLDVQREVMTAFLASDPGVAEKQAETPAEEAKPFALVGTIEEFEPGRSVRFRRVMDGREELYADDHTLGGRGVSRVDPTQNGLPVLPMTFSLEAMAEAASLLAPGKVVTALRDIRLYRWLPFDPHPTTLEVRATVAAVDPETGTVEVKADVRDLGNSFLRDAAHKPACEALLTLADHYPEPPAPLPFPLTNETPCRSTVEDLRRNMFHGPLFQMIRSLNRVGRAGIEGTLEVQPRDGWLASNPDPRTVLDPVLTDAAMHLLGAWHLEQPDWSGRILLPIGVRSAEYFGPPPAPGTRMLVRGHNEEETARQVRHGLEVFTPDGRPWLRLTGAAYWRFYLPFGEVNFFGPKDHYFLSRDWPGAAAGGGRCYFLEPPVDLTQPVLRAAGAAVTMTPREQAAFRAWAGPDAGLNDWFFGRLVAKDAVRAAWHAKHGEALFPADMETEDAPDGRLVVRPRGGPKAEPFPPMSVAAAGGKVVAFSAFAARVGVGLVILPRNADAATEQAARHRAACHAVADALRVAAEAVAVAGDRPGGVVAVALTPAAAARYPELGGRAVAARTARQKDAVAATTVCAVDAP